MVVVENAIDMEVWYFSLPCMMLASAAGCVWMRRRERATRQRSDDRNAAQHATGTGVGTGVVDEAAMATISSPSREARVQRGVGSGISPNRRVHVPPPSPYCVPRAAPVMDKIGVEILDLDTITLEDEKKLRENFSGESLFQMKVGWLDHQIRKLHTGDAAAIRLEVDRNDVFFDSFRALSKYTGEQLRGPLQVKFKREDGRDDGGLTRHWFMLISREVVNPAYAMFTLLGKREAYQIHLASKHQSHYLDYFRFIGRVWGKAIYDGFLVESHFSASVYKFILGRELALEDLVHVDLVYYNSLAWFLENDIEAAELELVFVLEEEAMGQIVKVPLKEGGDTCAITNENKAEYVQLAAMHRLVGSVRPQLEALRAGFYEVMAPNVLEKFSEGELELLLHGMPVIDIEDWKKHCEYRAGFTDTHQVILWFWEIVDDWDQEMRARLLQFVTGTSKIPTGGFAGLYGANGPKRFQIIRVFDITRLPQANTCFNELLLPPYPTKELLADRLTQSVYDCGDVFMLK